MKRVILNLISLFCLVMFISGCVKIDIDIKDNKIDNKNGDTLNFYICSKKGQKNPSNKLLLYIQGSGRFSVKDYSYRIAPAIYLGYDVLLVEKYGYKDKEVFYKTNSLQRRIEDIKFVLNYVGKDIYKDKLTEIAVMADSEGGVIAPEIAIDIKKLSGVIILGAGGLPLEEAFKILLNKQMGKKEGYGFFEYVGIFNQESLMNKFKEIKDNPSENMFWLGAPYKMWSISLEYQPINYIKKIQAPVLYIMGDKDPSVPVESLEYLIKELEGYKNFEFHVLPWVDHNFVN